MRIALVVLVLAALVALLLFRASRRVTGAEAGERMLEARVFGYGYDEAKQYLAGLGPDKRRHYLKRVIPLDRLFAFCYGGLGFWYGFGLSGALQRLGYARLSWLALGGGLCLALAAAADVLEGRAMARLINAFPALDADDAAVAARATVAKWALVIAGAALLILLSGMTMISWLKG